MRTLLFDSGARQVEGYGARVPCPALPSAGALATLAADCLEELHRQLNSAGLHIAAIATTTVWPDAPPPGPHLAASLGTEWPRFKGAVWLAPMSEGMALCLGSGCLTRHRFSLAFGTAGGVRAAIEGAAPGNPPPDFLNIRIDQHRRMLESRLGGSVSTIEWMRRVLALPRGMEARLDASIPGSHGVTLLPFVENRGVISGFSLATEAFDLFLAAFEAAALRSREACTALAGFLGPPREIIAAGPTLVNSPASVQMLADALGHAVMICTEPEPAARGAALLGLENAGVIASLAALPPQMGTLFEPREYQRSAYDALAVRERAMLEKLS